MSVFGRIVTAERVEQAVLATLRLWAPYYVAEIERQAGLTPALPAPRSYAVWSENESWPEHQLPAVIVVSPGITTEPRRDTGIYEATWRVSAGAVVSASDEAHTRRLAGIYVGALRAALVQHPSLGGLAQATVWVGEEIAADASTARSTAIGVADFDITVPAAVDPAGGPAMPPEPPPPADPWPDRPEVTQIDSTVIHQEDDTP